MVGQKNGRLNVSIYAAKDGDFVPKEVNSIYDVNQVRLNPAYITYKCRTVNIEIHIIEFLVCYTKLLNQHGHRHLEERMSFSGDMFRADKDGNLVKLNLFDISLREYIELTLSIDEAHSLHADFLNYIKMILDKVGCNLEDVPQSELIRLE